jgi:FkbM family methyltransferase
MDPVALMPKRLRQIARNYIERRGLRPIFDRGKCDTVWIDVGAHLGEGTLEAATRNPKLLVFAFEPNWALARQIMGRAANFVVLPMAVSDSDGFADFFINACDGSSSLVKMAEAGLSHWKDFDYTVKSKVVVQTIRLDTFMELADLSNVDYLKVDAEGTDLRVIQSAGKRLKDIKRVMLEVDVAPDRLYEGAPSRDEVIDFLTESGFRLVGSESQNAGRQENLTFSAPDVIGRHGSSGETNHININRYV